MDKVIQAEIERDVARGTVNALELALEAACERIVYLEEERLQFVEVLKEWAAAEDEWAELGCRDQGNCTVEEVNRIMNKRDQIEAVLRGTLEDWTANKK